LADGFDVAILVDALPRGEAPGTLYVLEPDLDGLNGSATEDKVEIETHGMDPVKVLRLAQALGSLPPRVLVVGCEPGELGSEDDMAMGLSAPVEANLDEAVRLVESLVHKIRAEIGPEE
jgi:hydrogenase maturation protease